MCLGKKLQCFQQLTRAAKISGNNRFGVPMHFKTDRFPFKKCPPPNEESPAAAGAARDNASTATAATASGSASSAQVPAHEMSTEQLSPTCVV